MRGNRNGPAMWNDAMISQSPCPPVDTLKRYSLGQYRDDEGNAIEQHLNGCAVCETTLAKFDSSHDSLVRHLPLTGRRQSHAEPPGWMQRLMAGPPADGLIANDEVAGPEEAENGDAEFGAYELTGILGRGGMGVVYDARHRQLGRPVAIKVLSPQLVAAKDAARRFHREIQVLGRLDHPGIVSATDAGKVGGAAYLVMERIDGVDLARLVRQAGPLSIGEACAVARQVALALAAAHQAAATHRDVKPSNVMVDRGGRVKLLDFGLAHLSESVSDHHDTSLGRLLGTLDYMAPEQAVGESVGPAADLYGLGATLFFLLTGRPPKASDHRQSLLQQLRAVADEVPPRLKDVRADVPESLSELVAQLLDRDPQSRPKDADELAVRMEAWADENAGDSLRALVASTAVPVGQTAHGQQAVAESFLELTGSVPGRVATQDSAAPDPAGGRGRAVVWALAGLGSLFAAVWLGIVLLIETPEGTLRIESEVEDIRIEVLGEDERVWEVEIEGDAEETRLKVGKYRLRLAAGYETLAVQPDAVVLRRGEQVVARIVQRPEPAPQDAPGDVPIYRGESLLIWQQRFAGETDPVARLEAAKALVAMAEPLPTEQRVARICHIGGEVLRSGWGDGALIGALHPYLFGYGFASAKWPEKAYPDLQKTWDSLVELSTSAVLGGSPEQTAAALTEVIGKAPLPNAIFAAILLEQRNVARKISEHPPAVDVLITDGTRPTDPLLDRHLVLIRSRLSEHASPEVQPTLATDVVRLGEHLASEENVDDRFAFTKALLARTDGVELPNELRVRMVLQVLLSQPVLTQQEFFQTRWYSDGEFAYPDQWMQAARKYAGPWWDEWIGVACDYLDRHPAETEQTAAVIETFNMLLRCRKKEDDWQTDELVKVLTDRLRARYRNADGDAAEQVHATSTHDLLAYIILAGGDIPEFVVRQQTPVADAEAYQAFLNALDEDVEWDSLRRSAENFHDLILSNPFQVVAAIVRNVSSFDQRTNGVVGGYPPDDELPPAPDVTSRHLTAIPVVITLLSTRGNGNDSPPPIEPLLLLAIAAELTGETEEQDEWIAEMFGGGYYPALFRRHIGDALDYPFVVREITEMWLRRMHERSTSEKLTEQLEKLMPALRDDAVPQAKYGQPYKSSRSQQEAMARQASANRDEDEQQDSWGKQSSPEFPAVKVFVKSEGGEPLVGASVTMKLLGEEARPVRVIAESADDGIAVDRVLPYGRYYVTVKTAAGWFTMMSEVMVEFGKNLELTIVAPAAGENATLVIDGRFKPADISELRFGVWQEAVGKVSAGYTVLYSPEPGVPLDRLATFPTLGDGIEEVALSISVTVHREVPQPDGSQIRWSWSPAVEEHPRRFLLTADHIYPIIDSDGEKARRRQGTPYFAASENSRLDVGYIEYVIGQQAELPTSLPLPAGRTAVYVTGIAGRPNAVVREALGVGEPSGEQQIWLPAELKRESGWVSRIMDLSHWRQRGEDESGLEHLARQEQELKQGATLRVKIEPPPAAGR